MFECLTLLKIEIIEYKKNGLQNGLKCVLRYIDFEKIFGGGPPDLPDEKGVFPSHTLPTRGFCHSAQDFGFQCPPPGDNISGSSPDIEADQVCDYRTKTADLVLIFAYAMIRFSNEAAQLKKLFHGQ